MEPKVQIKVTTQLLASEAPTWSTNSTSLVSYGFPSSWKVKVSFPLHLWTYECSYEPVLSVPDTLITSQISYFRVQGFNPWTHKYQRQMIHSITAQTISLAVAFLAISSHFSRSLWKKREWYVLNFFRVGAIQARAVEVRLCLYFWCSISPQNNQTSRGKPDRTHSAIMLPNERGNEDFCIWKIT